MISKPCGTTANLLAAVRRHPAATDEPDMFNWGGPFPIHPLCFLDPLLLVTYTGTMTAGEGEVGGQRGGGREHDPPTKQR